MLNTFYGIEALRHFKQRFIIYETYLEIHTHLV